MVLFPHWAFNEALTEASGGGGEQEVMELAAAPS